LFARVPAFTPNAGTQADISRVFELWKECLDRSGGPFLFGRFSIADAMYYPVLSRFRTYRIPLADAVEDYAHALEALPAVQQLNVVASRAPATPVYDDYIRKLGGNPDTELPVA
jgi:glutathione S-transferase